MMDQIPANDVVGDLPGEVCLGLVVAGFGRWLRIRLGFVKSIAMGHDCVVELVSQ